MIEVKGLNKVYDREYCVLQDISFVLPDIGLVVICGESGSGKTTLLNCLQGIESCEGKLIFDNVIMTSANVADIRKKYFSMVYQDYQLIENMTVESNLRIASECIGESISDDTISNLLASVGLDTSYAKKKCANMSGGEKQRVAMARAIAQNAKVILADEPTGNLDSTNSEVIWQILKEMSEEKLVIVITHNMELAELYSDYTIELSDGEIANTNLPNYTDDDIISRDTTTNIIITDNNNNYNKSRKTKLSGRSLFDIFRWINKDKILAILLSVFSIILLTVSMVMNVFSNVNYNDVVIKNLKNNPEHIVEIDLSSNINPDDIDNKDKLAFQYTLYSSINFNGSSYIGYNPSDYSALYTFNNGSTNYLIECNDLSDIGLKLKYGRNSTNINEILISDYHARYFIYSNFLYNGSTIKQESDVIGLTVAGDMTIVGIIDTNLDANIERFDLDRYDYTLGEVSDIEVNERAEFNKLRLFLHNTIDFNVAVVAEGYAKANNIYYTNCRSIYLSSKDSRVLELYNTYKVQDEMYPQLNSLYTYGLNEVLGFFKKNQDIFMFVMVVAIILSIAFLVVSALLILKNKVNDILIMRSLNMNRYKLTAIILLSLALLILLQIVVAAIINAATIAILNANFASVLKQAFTTLFFNWSFVTWFTIGCISSLAIIGMHILNLFRKPINYRKQKDKG